MDILKMKTKHEKPEEQEVLKWADILKEILNDGPQAVLQIKKLEPPYPE